MTRLSRSLALLALCIVSIPSWSANWQHSAPVVSVQQIRNGMELRSANMAVRVTALAPDVVRIRYAPRGQFVERGSFAVVDNHGLATPKVRLSQTAKAVELYTGAMHVIVRRNPLLITVTDNNGLILSEDSRPAAFAGAEFRVWKKMPIDEHYFGLGDKANPIDHRERAYTMWNTDAYGWVGGTDPLYKSIPFFTALRNGKSYGIFLDNTYRSHFDFGKAQRSEYSFGADGGDLDYYFFLGGDDPKRVVGLYTQLTGRTPLPPLWTLGYQQSRYSYFPEARVYEIAREFRNRRIPIDVLYLDIDYKDAYRAFTVDRTRFPNFEKMIGDLGAQGIQTIAIVDLHTKKQPGYRPYDDGVKGDHFVRNPDGSLYVGPVWPGDSVFPEFTRKATRDWYGSLYADLVKTGIRGFWNDMNEPAVFRYPEKTMPLDTVHRVENRRTDHREIHNVVGMQNVRATFDGILKLQPELRPFVLTRAAYAGTQRWAATWTGDNQSTWEHYRLTVPTLLSMGISGYGMIGADIGGFDGSPTADLLTRWIALGAFTPVFRNHTAVGTLDQEPWVHGAEHEAIRKRYIEARYRLMPYIYTATEEMARTGVPLMRPMFMEFPAEGDISFSDKTFMFGDDLMVAPKLSETPDAYEVKLPAGDWYDYWTGARVQRPVKKDERFMVTAALDQLPVYVRAGSIIPHQPLVQNLGEKPAGPLELHVYPGPDCRGTVYLDDGNTFTFREGEFLRQTFTCEARDGEVRVRISEPEGAFKPWWSAITVRVHGTAGQPAMAEVPLTQRDVVVKY